MFIDLIIHLIFHSRNMIWIEKFLFDMQWPSIFWMSSPNKKGLIPLYYGLHLHHDQHRHFI